MAMNESAQHPEQEQEPERIYRPDYIKVARAYEQRLAEAPDDAVLDTLRQTLAAYETEIRAIPRDRLPMLAFPDRLALAARMAGAFKPADRGDLGDLMAMLVEEFEVYNQETERRIENASRGTLPDGVEEAVLDVVTATNILWLVICDGALERGRTAADRRTVAAIDYLAERLNEHVARLRAAVHGEPDPDDDDDGQDLAA